MNCTAQLALVPQSRRHQAPIKLILTHTHQALCKLNESMDFTQGVGFLSIYIRKTIKLREMKIIIQIREEIND
jgi:hypothetical protein